MSFGARECLPHRPTLRASVGCGAEIVAAVWTEAGAIATTGAEDGAETDRGEDGEEESGEPVGEEDGADVVARYCVVNVAEAEERNESERGLPARKGFDRRIRRVRRRQILPLRRLMA